MHQAMPVQMRQGARQGQANRDAFIDGQCAAAFQIRAQGARNVRIRNAEFRMRNARTLRIRGGTFRVPHFALRIQIVGQFHHVIEIPRRIVAPHVQNIDVAFVRAGNRFEFENAGKLALVWFILLERRAMNHFDGPISARRASGQPYFTIAATADAPEQFVVGNERSKPRDLRLRHTAT